MIEWKVKYPTWVVVYLLLRMIKPDMVPELYPPQTRILLMLKHLLI